MAIELDPKKKYVDLSVHLQKVCKTFQKNACKSLEDAGAPKIIGNRFSRFSPLDNYLGSSDGDRARP